MKVSHKFESPEEILKFIKHEVMKYTGCFNLHQVLYSYNRLTVEELAQEVYLKLLRAVNPKGLNKAYIRQAVIFVCIDEYRRYRLNDPTKSPETLESSEVYGFEITERLMNLKLFNTKELSVILHLMEGKRNSEVREILKIPKMSYYTLLGRIRNKYILES